MNSDFSRRHFITTAASTFLGVSASKVLSAPGLGTSPLKQAATARNVIYLYMTGGMSHLDTWDPKPDNKEVMGLTKTINTNVDGIPELKLCTGYRIDGRLSDILPVGADDLERCEPVYESMPGWTESTVGVKSFEGLPKAAQNYIKRMEALCGVPVDMISTGPDREETIVLRHPFK